MCLQHLWGTKTHDEDFLGGGTVIKKRQTENLVKLPSNTNKKANICVSKPKETESFLPTSVYQEKNWIFCNTKKSVSATFDVICLEVYRKFIICKKTHLIEDLQEGK